MLLHYLKNVLNFGEITMEFTRVQCAIFFLHIGHNLPTHLHSAHWHSEMDCNITIPILADLLAIISLHCVEIWFDLIQ